MKHKKFFSLSLLLWLLFPIVANAFSDISGASYEQAIIDLSSRSYIQGYKDGTFRPYHSINRAEFITLLLRDAPQEVPSEPCFPDVAVDSWYAPSVCTAKERGLIQGYPDGSFQPAAPITMVESFAVLSRSYALTLSEPTTVWYQPLVSFFHDSGIFSKYSYLPSHTISREETAHALLALMNDQEGTNPLPEVRSHYSSACGSTQPENPPLTFFVDGEERQAIVDVPQSYQSGRAYPLIFAFHGRTSSNERVRSYFRLGSAAGEEAILVYPSGRSVSSSTYTWTPEDYGFFDVMLQELSSTYCVDLDRVYLVGHSLGAWFANTLACARGHTVRAVASLGGSRTISSCSGPVAAMIWHNPEDNLVSFSQGETARDLFLEQNQCSRETTELHSGELRCVTYQGCQSSSPVVWCPHTKDTYSRGQYTPHTWPRGTASVMWEWMRNLP